MEAGAESRRYVRILGTPNESTWPGVSQLADFKPTFPQWDGVDLAEAVHEIDTLGVELLHVRSPLDPHASSTYTLTSVFACV